MPKYRIKSDILGVDFGIQTDQKLTERDYFDILKTKVGPQKMLRAYKQNKDDEEVQALATKALDNNYFEGADFGTAFSEGGKSFGRGVKNLLVTNIYGTSRLLDATMQYGEADESQRYDELVEEGIKKAGQQLKGLSYASKRTDRTIEDDLSKSLQFAGLSQEDENLKKRVIAEARRQDNSQAEATRAQMGVDAVGMMSMLGAKLFQGLGDAEDIVTGKVSFGGDSKKRKLRQLDYLIEQDYIGRTIERGAELGLQLGGAMSTISQVYTGMDLSPFEKNEEALRDVKSGLVKPDRDVAMLGSMFADPGMGATVLASGGLAFGRNFIARGAIIKTGQKAAQESAFKSTIAQLSDIANPTSTQKTLLKTAEKNLSKVTGSGEKLEKLVAKAEGIAQAEAGKLLQNGQGNTPMAARLYQAIDKAPPPKAPFSNRMTGKILEKAGISAEYLGRTIEFLQRLPEETLGTLFMRSGMDEQAAMTASRATARTLQGTAAAGVVTGGFNEFTPELENLGLALLLAPGGSSLVTRFGHDAAILGKQLQYAQTSSPLFQRIAQLDPADSSLTAVTLDRTSALTIPGTISGLAEGIFAKSRQFGPSPALKAPATALTRTGLGNTLTGAVNTTKTAIGASAIPGAIGYAVDGEAGAGGAIAASIPFIAAGLGFGTLARYGSQADVRAKMLGDQAYYKDTYLTGTEVGMYDGLAKPVRQAIATSVIQNPDVVYRFQNDRGNSHWSVENGESVVTIFTKSAPQEQLSAVLGHEIAHHIDAFGFMPQILQQLVGSVEKNQPGLFTEYKNGKPVIIKDAEGRDVYATNKEFAKHRQSYLDRLEQSGIDKNSPDYQAYANDDSRIAREIFASHGAAWYFGGDFVTRNYQGAGAKMMGAILDPLFSSPGLRKFFHRIGLATQETTGLVADPLRLFPELKEVPALTRMIEKYNDDVRGFGPQARREGRGRGNLVDPEFADEIATASLTAKDLENPAIVNRLKAGGVVKIKDDGSIETDASGKPVFLPSREVNKKNKQLSQDILQIIRKKEDAGETFGEGHVSLEKAADGKERAAGRFLDPSIIDELAKTGKYNPHQLAALKQISQTLRNNTGDVWNLFYYSALKWNKAGRKVYGQIKGGDRKSLPFGIEITKDGNINIQTISVDAFKKNLEWFAKSKGYEKKMSEAFGGMNAWENAQNAYKLLPTYLQNHMKGIINGEKGSGINPLQRDLINAAIGRVNADQVKANPILEGLGDRRSQRQQSIRSRRLDRIGNAIRGESGFPAFKSAIEQNKVPMFMPGRGKGDKLFMPMSKEETIFAEVMSDSKFKSDSKRRAEMVKRGVPQDRDFLELGQEVRKKLGIAPYESIKDAYKAQNQDKLFMPASEAGAGKGKQAEAAKLWNEKGTDSPYFKKWFGKSKVVDENGEPLVVYRGDTEPNIEVYDLRKAVEVEGGIFFTDDIGVADQYTYERAYGEIVSDEPLGNVTEAYLSFDNPLEYKLKPSQDFVDAIEMTKAIRSAKGKGFDSMIIKNIDDSIGMTGDISDIFVAFKPEQIKSATGNRGTFDAGERNILFMPASEAKNPKSGDMLTLDDSSLKLFLPSPNNPNASTSDFKGKNVQVLTTDLSMVGDKKIDGATVAFTGGPGYLSVNDAWGFTNESSAKGFRTRWEREDRPLIGLTSMKQDNHKASTLTREYYVRKLMQAVNQGKIEESLVNKHITEALSRVVKGKGLTDSQKRALMSVKNIEDFLRIFTNGQIIPWKATPKIYDRLSQATLPIKQGRLKELGLDLDTILRETRQKEYNDIKKGSLLAIAEYDGSDAVYRPDLNSAYPWSIPLKEKAFLKEFADIQDLSSRQDLRGSDGEANMAVAMGAGVMLDKLGRGDVNFMPSDPKAPKAQPTNRINRQAPAMPGNRFMAPAVSAGAKSAERFR